MELTYLKAVIILSIKIEYFTRKFDKAKCAKQSKKSYANPKGIYQKNVEHIESNLKCLNLA